MVYTVSGVPSGLVPTGDQAPNVEMLGYYRSSFRDDDLRSYWFFRAFGLEFEGHFGGEQVLVFAFA